MAKDKRECDCPETEQDGSVMVTHADDCPVKTERLEAREDALEAMTKSSSEPVAESAKQAEADQDDTNTETTTTSETTSETQTKTKQAKPKAATARRRKKA